MSKLQSGLPGLPNTNTLFTSCFSAFSAVELISVATLLMIHLSKLAEDLIIFSTTEFGFVTLSDAYR